VQCSAWLKKAYETVLFEVSPKNELKVLTFGSNQGIAVLMR
jgi:hypothetical protein